MAVGALNARIARTSTAMILSLKVIVSLSSMGTGEVPVPF